MLKEYATALVRTMDSLAGTIDYLVREKYDDPEAKKTIEYLAKVEHEVYKNVY